MSIHEQNLYLFFPGSLPESLYFMYSTRLPWLTSKHIERGLFTREPEGKNTHFYLTNFSPLALLCTVLLFRRASLLTVRLFESSQTFRNVTDTFFSFIEKRYIVVSIYVINKDNNAGLFFLLYAGVGSKEEPWKKFGRCTDSFQLT